MIGATSDPLPVCSGVPQGSILGPALFLLYVNNLPDVIKSSQVSMFADDTKVFSTIRSQDDVKSLQTDLVNLEHWSCVSGLTFNQSKCKHQRITQKILPVTSSYELGNHLIDTTENEKDLGVWLSSKLSWKKQVNAQTAKANKLLGHISRNTTVIRNTTARRSMYLTLVRSHFCYASQVWAPQSIELLQKLERTQRRATKYILNLPFSIDIEYKTRLQSLNVLPLCYWHEYLDLILFFKITKGLVFSRLRPQPVSSSRRITRSTSNSVKYIVPRSKTTTYQKSFLIRSCRIRNILADDLNFNIDISLYSLKTILHDYYFAALDIDYNPENPKTFKTVCLKCNFVRSLTSTLTCCN